MSRKFQAPAILNSVSYTKDGGLRLGFVTNELDDESKILASSYYQNFGYVLFKENAFTEEDVPKENAEGKYKSKGAHYRAVLYALWAKIGQPGDFETYYSNHMDEQVNALKSQLQALDED